MQNEAPISLLGFVRDSFERYLQLSALSQKSSYSDQGPLRAYGLHAALNRVFPLVTKDGLTSLEYISYSAEEPKYSIEECLLRGMTYAAPLKLVLRLVLWEIAQSGDRFVRDLKEQEVYFGELPLLTERGCFIINGEARVLVSQLQRRPGVLFSREPDSASALITAWHGAQLCIKRHHSGRLTTSIELPDALLRSEVLHPTPKLLLLRDDALYVSFEDALPGRVTKTSLTAPDGAVIVAKGQRLTAKALKSLRASGAVGVQVSARERASLFAAENLYVNDALLLSQGQLVSAAQQRLQAQGVSSLRAYSSAEEPVPPKETTFAHAPDLLYWFDTTIKRLELSTAGRLQLKGRLELSTSDEETALLRSDLESILSRLREELPADDPHDLAGLALLAAGEQLRLQSWFGLTQMAASITSRMNLCREPEVLMPSDLLNATPHMTRLRHWFEQGPTSQRLDLTNPLATLCHVRRIIAPTGFVFGGHPSHQGRLSNQELALSCTLNELGFLESPPANKGSERDARSLAEALVADVVTTPELDVTRSGARALCAALPLYHAAPLPDATGLSSLVVKASGCVRTATQAGVVSAVLPSGVLVSVDDEATLSPDLYPLSGMTALVQVGQHVEAGEPLAAKLTSQRGALTLGRKVRVAFVDGLKAAQASTRLQHLLTSQHLIVLECAVCDTRMGKEFLRRDLPEVAVEKTRHLDETGIVTLGAQVGAGDVLIGKRTPKHPEDVDSEGVDSSLYVPEGCGGKILDVALFARGGVEPNARHQQLIEEKERRAEALLQATHAAINEKAKRRIRALLVGAQSAARLVDDQGALLLKLGETLTAARLDAIALRFCWELEVSDDNLKQELSSLWDSFQDALSLADDARDEARDRGRYRRDALPPGVIMFVKITIEQERPLMLGDVVADCSGRRWAIEELFEDEAHPTDLRLPKETTSRGDVEVNELYLLKLKTP